MTTRKALEGGYSRDPGFDQKYLFDCSLGSGTRQNLGMGWGIFGLFVGNSGNRHDPNKLSHGGQSRLCLLSNQTIECTWLIVILLKLSESILFEPDAGKVHAV